jgi:hypothetical protein
VFSVFVIDEYVRILAMLVDELVPVQELDVPVLSVVVHVRVEVVVRMPFVSFLLRVDVFVVPIS